MSVTFEEAHKQLDVVGSPALLSAFVPFTSVTPHQACEIQKEHTTVWPFAAKIHHTPDRFM